MEDIQPIKVKVKQLPVKCPVCNGYGTYGHNRVPCQACEGKGIIMVDAEEEGGDK